MTKYQIQLGQFAQSWNVLYLSTFELYLYLHMPNRWGHGCCSAAWLLRRVTTSARIHNSLAHGPVKLRIRKIPLFTQQRNMCTLRHVCNEREFGEQLAWVQQCIGKSLLISREHDMNYWPALSPLEPSLPWWWIFCWCKSTTCWWCEWYCVCIVGWNMQAFSSSVDVEMDVVCMENEL